MIVLADTTTRQAIDQLGHLLSPGDLVDGDNARFTDDKLHADLLSHRGIGYLDCGVSDGVWGRKNGYALRVGGDAADHCPLMPIFDALRPDCDTGCP